LTAGTNSCTPLFLEKKRGEGLRGDGTEKGEKIFLPVEGKEVNLGREPPISLPLRGKEKGEKRRRPRKKGGVSFFLVKAI